MKRLGCPSCGANLVLGQDNGTAKCRYCGADVVLTEELKKTAQTTISDEVVKASKSAISFMNSLMVEIKGQRANIAEMWNGIISNPDMGITQATQFYKNLKTQILFCINVYNELSSDVKYEIGDFICAQMESIINFRTENYFIYLEELDEIDALIRKLNHDYGARGFFEFKRKRAIKAQIARIDARKVVVLYDYKNLLLDKIVSKYNTKIAPIKEELNSTTALKRKKELKNTIDWLENQKKVEIDSLGLKELTKEYNKVVAKYNIQHEDLLQKEIISERQKIKEDQIRKAETKQQQVVAEQIDYSKKDTISILDEISVSLDKLAVGITKSEIENAKALVNELSQRLNSFNQEAMMYCNAVIMSMNLILDKEGQPSVFKATLQAMASNTKMQINNLKLKINN